MFSMHNPVLFVIRPVARSGRAVALICEVILVVSCISKATAPYTTGVWWVFNNGPFVTSVALV